MLFPGSRQLRLARILATFALAGCGSGHSGGAGYASFEWDISDIDSGTALTCAQIGAATVTVTLFDALGTPVMQNTGNCASGQTSTSNVPTGSYTVGLDLYGDPNTYGGGTPLLDSFDLADSSGTPVVFPIGPGLNDFRSYIAPFVVRSFVVGWSFASGSAASMCGTAATYGARYVDLDFTVTGGTTTVAKRFDCALGQGVSYPYPYPDSRFPGGQTTTQWWLYLVDSTGADITYIDGGTVTLQMNANVNLGTRIFPY
jgi:hypothetical protein